MYTDGNKVFGKVYVFPLIFNLAVYLCIFINVKNTGNT